MIDRAEGAPMPGEEPEPFVYIVPAQPTQRTPAEQMKQALDNEQIIQAHSSLVELLQRPPHDFNWDKIREAIDRLNYRKRNGQA